MGIRCFVAIPLDAALKKEIATSVADLKKASSDVRWVQAESLHATLKFLGDTNEDLLQPLYEKLLPVSASHRPFTLGIRGVGLFPKRGKPRVIWIDIQSYQELAKLQEDVEDALVTIGFDKEERFFSPHLTIGRVKGPRNINTLLQELEALKDKDFGTIEVRSFSLMKSELKPTGAEYTILKEFDLKKEAQ